MKIIKTKADCYPIVKLLKQGYIIPSTIGIFFCDSKKKTFEFGLLDDDGDLSFYCVEIVVTLIYQNRKYINKCKELPYKLIVGKKPIRRNKL